MAQGAGQFQVKLFDCQGAIRQQTPGQVLFTHLPANFSVEGIDHGKLGAHLWERYRIICTPIAHEEFKGIRITPNVYTTLADIDTFCDAVERAIRSGLAA